MHLKINILSQRSDRQLEGRAVVARNRMDNTTFKRKFLSINWTRKEQTEGTAIFLILLTPKTVVTKESRLKTRHCSAVNILRSFVDNVEIDVS